MQEQNSSDWVQLVVAEKEPTRSDKVLIVVSAVPGARGRGPLRRMAGQVEGPRRGNGEM